jgi:hypothetical protein
MMMPYVPRLMDAIITALICIVLMAIGAVLDTKTWTRIAIVFYIGALIFAVMTALVLWRLVVEGLGQHLERQTHFAEVFHLLDDEGRRALAFQFPSMHYHMRRGIVRSYFEDTQVPIEMFRLFLQTSNDKYISPRRDWYTTEQPEWAWEEIKTWLEENDKILPDSAAGSHSWLWKGSAYQQLMAYWMAGRRLVDMSEIRTYAYDLPTPPPEDDAGGG